ncbi:hypothetical protein AG1IA_06312 [Rhizoctonia solani AG-1 IA]|uniref:Uncharacterized protein n=1 Tax=Thanatephorus cucumeris (strain AG1-IA) TaxID=983506 RepID=L8WNB7_THACA|nr:hypothetical protein AG1IA_06312 [Rhizoctonia solani AG-1 IA]
MILRSYRLEVGASASAFYSARLAFGVRQSTRLSTNAEGFVHWTLPTAQKAGSDKNQPKGTLKAINDTQEQKDICIGTIDNDKSGFSPMICCNGATAAVDFLPHTDLIRGEVENFLGNWDLSSLQNAPTDNRFHLFEDKNDGQRGGISSGRYAYHDHVNTLGVQVASPLGQPPAGSIRISIASLLEHFTQAT